MAIRDLVPWSNQNRDVSTRRSGETNPFLTLHREMNRLFDDRSNATAARSRDVSTRRSEEINPFLT